MPSLSYYPRIPVSFYSISFCTIWSVYKKTDSLFNTLSVHFLQRTKEFFQDCFGHSISEGTLVNHTKAFASQLQPFVQEAKEKILQSLVVHFDETGMRVEGKTQWLHTASTPGDIATYSCKTWKRSHGCGEILPSFSGIAMHDGWKPYDMFTDCRHVLCNAHLLRDLQGIIDSTEKNGQNKCRDF